MLQELPAVRATSAEEITRIAYQTQYGIYNHQADNPENPQRPLAVVALHPKENCFEGGMEMSLIRKFMAYRLGELFNLSLTEFFQLPAYRALVLLEMGESAIRFKDSRLNDVDRELAKQLKQ